MLTPPPLQWAAVWVSDGRLPSGEVLHLARLTLRAGAGPGGPTRRGALEVGSLPWYVVCRF